MEFFNKLGDSIQNVGKEVTKKTKDLSGVVTLTAQIKESESSLEKVYRTIGEKYYASFREEAENRFTEETDEILKIQQKLEKDREQLRTLKGLKLCLNCGAEVDINSIHCPMCGTELRGSSQVQGQSASPGVCSVCGAPLSDGAKFCGRCGARVN